MCFNLETLQRYQFLKLFPEILIVVGLRREDGVYLLFTVPWIIVDQVGKLVSKYKIIAVSKELGPWVRGGQRYDKCRCPLCLSLPLQ